MKHLLRLATVKLALLLTVSAAGQTVVPWLTRSHDSQRTGWNSQETKLTQASIAAKGLSIKAIVPVYGDARGIEAQPLVVPAVTTKTGVQDVMLLCSMANQCRAVNYETGADIWDVTLGMPITGGASIDMHLINQHWGALPTGVVDPNTNRWYQVFWASPDGTGDPQTGRWYMAVLNVADGTQVVPPVMITGTSQGYDFNAEMRKARSSAVLLNQNGTRTVLECTGTVLETAPGSAGFCFTFDTYTNAITTMTATTAGEGAGVWMAGDGPACALDSSACYIVTGNGDFAPPTQWGESFIPLLYTPPTAATPANMAILKGWSPYTDFQRSGQALAPATKLAGESLASEMAKPVGGGMSMPMKGARIVGQQNAQWQFVSLVYPAMASGNWSDEDWGSGGPACIFSIGYCVAAGKDGLGYVLPVPGFTGTTAASVGTVANCQYAQPVWLTMSPGPVNPCPTDLTALNFFPGGDTAHLHMTPIQYFDPVLNSWTIFAWGENQQLHKWSISSTGQATWIANGHEYASANVRDNPPGGMSGGFCTGSSNGNDPNSAIVVCEIPVGDANANVVVGRTLVYDAVHLGADGYLKTIWDSFDWGGNVPGSHWYHMFNKFLPDVIDGGEVIQGTYDGRVYILGQ